MALEAIFFPLSGEKEREIFSFESGKNGPDVYPSSPTKTGKMRGRERGNEQ
jgi:hypothetical protein